METRRADIVQFQDRLPSESLAPLGCNKLRINHRNLYFFSATADAYLWELGQNS
jgi:hypothetical protein